MIKEVAAFAIGVFILFGLNSVGQSIVGPVVCHDGWHSSSIGRQGACSHHGGVNRGPQDTVGVISFFTGVFGGFYFYGVLCTFSERRKKKEMAVAVKQYEEDHKDDPHCSRHPEERMVKRHGKYGEFWGCPRYPRCKTTRNLKDVAIHKHTQS